MSADRGPAVRIHEPVQQAVGTIERAFQLAEQSESVDAIRSELKKEGHSNVDAHLQGGTIRSELARIIKREDND